jgi:hypothetical protein
MVRIVTVVDFIFQIFPYQNRTQDSSCPKDSGKYYFDVSLHININFSSQKQIAFLFYFLQNDIFYNSVGFFYSSVNINCLTSDIEIILNQEIKQ